LRAMQTLIWRAGVAGGLAGERQRARIGLTARMMDAKPKPGNVVNVSSITERGTPTAE
jgi:hypothetical protein